MIATLLGNTVMAALLAAAVLLIGRLAQLSPATRHALWLIVVVKLLSPLGLLWSAPLPIEEPSLLRTIVTASPQTVAAAADQPLANESMLMQLAIQSPAELAGESFTVELKGESTASSDASLTPRPWLLALYQWLLIVWLAGALLMTWRYLSRTIRFARYARSGRPAGPSLLGQVAELSALLGVRPPRVQVLRDLPSPVLWCLGGRTLLWPRGLQDELTAAGRRAVLVHELAHLRRCDHWARWLEMLAAVVHWWNPLFWLARRQMRLHAELACDAWVTGTFPSARRSYAEALLEVCMRTSRAAPSPGMGVGGEGHRDFEQRLSMIMRERAPGRLPRWARAAIVVMAAAAVPAWTFAHADSFPAPEPDRANADADGSPRAEALEADGDQPTSKEFDLVLVQPDKDRAEWKLEQMGTALTRNRPMWLRVETKPNEGNTGAGAGGGVFRLFGAPGAALPMVRPNIVPGATPPNAWPVYRADQPLQGQTLWLEGAQSRRLNGGDKPVTVVSGGSGQEFKGPRLIGGGSGKAAGGPLPSGPGPEVQTRLLHQTMQRLAEINRNSLPKQTALSRTTYKLPKEKADALAAFLKANVKAPLLEIKVDDKGVTVTTTVEAQATIDGIVKLMEGAPVSKAVLIVNRAQEDQK
jgi:beta-lactamase regulating signal transducer with metallopeptidase domain